MTQVRAEEEARAVMENEKATVSFMYYLVQGGTKKSRKVKKIATSLEPIAS